MIYMEPQQLGWSPLRDSYMSTLPESVSTEHRKLVRLQACIMLLLYPLRCHMQCLICASLIFCPTDCGLV